MKVIKRDGKQVIFNRNKITDAIFKSFEATENKGNCLSHKKIAKEISKIVENKINAKYKKITVEEIQNIVENTLIEKNEVEIAKSYILYRRERTRIRTTKSQLMEEVSKIEKETLRDNANVGNSPAGRMLQVGSVASKEYYINKVIPKKISDSYLNGEVHIHDLDYYGKTINCMQIPIGDMLEKGFNTGHGYVRPPKRIGTAVMLSCIILQSCQNDMYGGQSFANFDKDIKKYIPKEYGKLKKESNANQKRNQIEDEVYQAMESLVFNLNTMHSRAGSQVPFSSINFGTDTTSRGRLVIRKLLEAFNAGLGKGETPIFPNLIFKLKKGVNFEKGDPNYDLYQLALKVAGKRMNPTFSFMDSSFNKQYGDKTAYMGCRSRVMDNRHGDNQPESRGNIAPISINLPRLGITSETISDFFNNLNEIIEICEEQLIHRYKICKNLKVKDIPFVMGDNIYLDSEELKPNDSIEKAIKNGTLSIGFIGLAECLKALVGKHHGEDEETQMLGLKIVAHLKNKLDEMSEKHDLNFTCYATPAEGLSGRFIAIDKDDFGEIEGVTDKDFYTNSFHVPVYYNISFENKIKKEGPYHKMTNAGHISYIELPSSIEDNIEALENIHKAMSEADMGYAGINFPIDECLNCNHSGLILEDECPICKGEEIRRIRRVTGYLSTLDRFGVGKKSEHKHRTKHL